MVVVHGVVQPVANRADLALPGGLQYREGGLFIIPEIDCALDGPGALRWAMRRGVMVLEILLSERPQGASLGTRPR